MNDRCYYCQAPLPAHRSDVALHTSYCTDPDYRAQLVLEDVKWLAKQNDATREVFEALKELAGEHLFIGFAPIERYVGLSRTAVRSACRHLARRGLAKYEKGLWNETTGDPAGAGYGLTERGRSLVNYQDWG